MVCWKWLDPSTFQYGAHDFHSVDKDGEWIEIVSGANSSTSAFAHVALVVSGMKTPNPLNPKP